MPKKIVAVIQARSSSSRLPGKVLAPVLDEPMIVHQLHRISNSRNIQRVVVATSADPTDDELADLLDSRGFTVRRGPLDDVYARFADVVAEYDPKHIVRLTADCPLTDPEVIDLVIEAHLRSGADYTSNSMIRTFPHGLDVECMTATAFRALGELKLTQDEREHVTLGIYSRPDRFTLHPVTQPLDTSGLRWTVDYPEDLDFVRGVYEALYPRNPAFTTADILAYLEANPDKSRTTSDV